MRVAIYARVSTTRQAQAQTIEQQLDRLRRAVAEHGWTLEEEHVYRDDGYSGAGLSRPGLDRLRDQAALAELDLVLVTAPDRLARNYVHQVLLIDELGRHGCQVEFLDRPMSHDPHDQLLLQIRGAVAEYERTLIAERMRRGRQAKLRAGTLLPWTTPPFGYRLDPERPRDVAGVRVEPGEAVLVAQLFDWYLEPQATVYRLAKRLTDLQVATPTGKPRWNAASVRGILRNPAYTGRALTNRTRVVPARRRKSALLPVGPGESHTPRPQEDWIAVPVPQIVSEETFARVQAKLDTNQQTAARNTRHEYLLRALVSCGRCRLSCTVRRTQAGYHYYLCRGRTDALRAAQGQRCTARYTPAEQLDELVWADLRALLCDPAQVARALERARGGAWLPQQLQARQTTIRQALAQLDRQQQRLLDAYLAEVVGLAELEHKRQELDRRRATLATQQRQLDAIAEQRLELRAIADGIQAFCQTVRAGLATATFAQRRLLVELLIDRVVVTDDKVEIRYVLPTSPDGPHPPFCQLRKDHLHPPARPRHPHQLGQGGAGRAEAGIEGQLPVGQPPPDQQPEPPARPAGPGQRDPGPVVDPGALGAIPGAQPAPGAGGQVGDQLAGWDLGGTLLAGRPQRLGGLDRQHIGDTPLLQEGAQARVAAVDLIGGHPPGRHARLQRALQHRLGQLRLGRKADPLGHVRLRTAPGVGDPLLGQVQLPVHQRPTLSAGIGEEHADLAVLDPPGGARILALHPGRLGALLEEAGLIHHQHPVRVAELLGDVAAHVVAERAWVPAGAGQQPLHPVRGGLLRVLGQLPAVLAVNPTQQATQEPGGTAADLRADEPWADPLAQPLELRCPALDLSQHALPPPRSAQQKARNLPHAKCGCSKGMSDGSGSGRMRLPVAQSSAATTIRSQA
jgi:site-specific DNA recombinase